jgi:ABC-2 type transport system ATP-binding protein
MMKSAGTSVISAQNLTKVFGSQIAVDDLSFEVQPGRVTGFLGPNGAGKTTTLRMILGLARPTSGDARVNGYRYLDLEAPSQTVGALLDASHFHRLRTGRNHLRVLTAAAGVADQRVNEALELVDLSYAADRKVGHYSLGMRQRLGLAAALLGDPGVLVLDEPANGLDPSGIRWLRGFLRSFAEDGRAVFVSSHLIDEISHIADEVVVINKGKLVAHAPVHDLTAQAAARVRIRTPDVQRLFDLLVLEDIHVQRERDGQLIAAASGEQVGIIAVRARIPIFGLRPEDTTLEDVFFQLTEAKEEASR